MQHTFLYIHRSRTQKIIFSDDYFDKKNKYIYEEMNRPVANICVVQCAYIDAYVTLTMLQRTHKSTLSISCRTRASITSGCCCVCESVTNVFQQIHKQFCESANGFGTQPQQRYTILLLQLCIRSHIRYVLACLSSYMNTHHTKRKEKKMCVRNIKIVFISDWKFSIWLRIVHDTHTLRWRYFRVQFGSCSK